MSKVGLLIQNMKNFIYCVVCCITSVLTATFDDFVQNSLRNRKFKFSLTKHQKLYLIGVKIQKKKKLLGIINDSVFICCVV